MEDCIFCQIANHQVPNEFMYEDEDIVVFPDIHPLRPTHLLIVPKKHFTDFLSLDSELLWNKIRETAQNMVRQFDLEETGFRLSLNGGGAQQINHLHLHLMGPMGKAV